MTVVNVLARKIRISILAGTPTRRGPARRRRRRRRCRIVRSLICTLHRRKEDRSENRRVQAKLPEFGLRYFFSYSCIRLIGYRVVLSFTYTLVFSMTIMSTAF